MTTTKNSGRTRRDSQREEGREAAMTGAPIHPATLYTIPWVAGYLGLHPDTLFRMPPGALPRVRIGPQRGLTRIRGADLTDYLDGLCDQGQAA